MTTSSWIGKFAEVRGPGTPGWGPEGAVAYPEGVGGFIVGSDDHGRPVVRLSHYYGKSNQHLTEYGEVAFDIDSLHVGERAQSWGEDDRGGE